MPDEKGDKYYQDPDSKYKNIMTNKELKKLPTEELLARTIWAEGRSCDLREKYYIGRVIKNRMKSNRFPDTFENVMLQPQQFSCWNVPARLNPNNEEEFKNYNFYKARSKNLKTNVDLDPYIRIANEVMEDFFNWKYKLPHDILHYYVYKPNQVDISLDNKIENSYVPWSFGATVFYKGKHVFLQGVD